MTQNGTSVHNFSLLKKGTFRVNFDCYTARPHFIIVLDDKSSMTLPKTSSETLPETSPKTLPKTSSKTLPKTYDDLSVDQIEEVISSALQMVNKYSLYKSRPVLSQHCGTWYSSKYNYHAHLCVDTETYLNILGSKRNELKNWPHKDQDIKEYPINGMVDEVNKITEAEKKFNDVGECTDNVLFHPSEPRVGFVYEKSNKPTNPKAWCEVQKKLMLYARQKDLLGRGKDLPKEEKDYHGCHVCLVLDGETHGKSTLSLS